METAWTRRGHHAHFRARHRRQDWRQGNQVPSRLPAALAIAAYLMVAAWLIH
jgi:hypothetical protein